MLQYWTKMELKKWDLYIGHIFKTDLDFFFLFSRKKKLPKYDNKSEKIPNY